MDVYCLPIIAYELVLSFQKSQYVIIFIRLC